MVYWSLSLLNRKPRPLTAAIRAVKSGVSPLYRARTTLHPAATSVTMPIAVVLYDLRMSVMVGLSQRVGGGIVFFRYIPIDEK